MKLEGCHGGALYASAGRTVLAERSGGSFESLGRLPAPGSGFERLRHHAMRSRPWKGMFERIVGAFATTHVWRVDEGAWLATAGPWLFSSRDGGVTWRPSRRLPQSSGPAGVLPTSVCHQDGETYLGEYPLDAEEPPRILRSTDRGATWESLCSLPSVRHVHALQVDPYTGDLWVTTGDADEECMIGRLRGGDVEPIGGGSQAWRAVELVFTPSAILWGMDCAYADANRIFALDRDDLEDDPTRVHAVPDSVYYGESIEVDGTTWAVFATAAETGPDTTAPGESTGGPGTAAVVAASEATGFAEWHELATYRKRRRPVDRYGPLAALPNACAYVFLASDPERGLFVNPYNTATDHGRIVRVPLERFAALPDTP